MYYSIIASSSNSWKQDRSYPDNNVYSSSLYAILFKESLGYILSKPMLHGSQGQVYIIISLEGGKSYGRKKLEDLKSFRGLPFYQLLPTCMVPELIPRIEYPYLKEGDALIFQFCNRRGLRAFRN